jgi:uncharacterized protein GlcG (DUF336 family)
MFFRLLSMQGGGKVIANPSAFMESTVMGYLISFVLGVFVATVGVSGVATALDKVVQKTQVYMLENVK